MIFSVVDIIEMNRFDVKTLVTLLGIFALSSFLLMHFFHLLLQIFLAMN